MELKKIGIVGVGYVGGALANWFQKKPENYEVFLYDKFKKIGSLEEVNRADVVFVCVPTPFYGDEAEASIYKKEEIARSGDATRRGYDDSAVRDVLQNISNGKVAVIKSTIRPGSVDMFQAEYSEKTILFNPEFLRAKTANEDFLNPDRQIVGYSGEANKKIAEEVLSILPDAPYARVMRAKEAEMVKYFGNVYLATRVVFANQMYDMCDRIGGIDYDVVRESLVQDKRIGDSHFGVFSDGYRGYGGTCFPKDVKAFLELADQLGVNVDLIKATDEVNEKLRKRTKK